MAQENSSGGIGVPIYPELQEKQTKTIAERTAELFNKNFNKTLKSGLKKTTKSIQEQFEKLGKNGQFTSRRGLFYDFSQERKRSEDIIKQRERELKQQQKLETVAAQKSLEIMLDQDKEQRKLERKNEISSMHREFGPQYKGVEKTKFEISETKKSLHGLEGLFVSIDNAGSRLYENVHNRIESTLGDITNLTKKLEKQRKKQSEKDVTKRAQSSLLLAQTLGANLTGADKQKAEITVKETELKGLENLFNTKVNNGRSLNSKSMKELQAQIAAVNAELVKMKNDYKEATKIGPIQRLINTFKRIGFYRLARNIFRLIGNNMKTGLSDLASYSSEFNKLTREFQSSGQIINDSFSLMLSTVLEQILPTVQSLSTYIANIANGISKASAALKGATTYTAINAEYLKSMSESASQLSFDNFEALSGTTETAYTTLTLTPDEAEEAANSKYATFLKTVSNIISTIQKMLKNIAPIVQKIIDVITDNADVILKVVNTLLDILSWIIDKSTDFVNFLDETGLLTTAIYGTLLAIVGLKLVNFFASITSSIKTLTTNTKSLSTAFTAVSTALVSVAAGFLTFQLFDKVLSNAPQWVKWLTTIIAAVAALAFALNASKGPVMVGLTAVALGAAVAGIKSLISDIPTYAKGGMVEEGSLFIAGEAGAELVTSAPSGRTEVTNVTQVQQAMVGALYECADLFKQNSGDVVLNLDGAEVARSKRFTSELNRKNAGLKLR